MIFTENLAKISIKTEFLSNCVCVCLNMYVRPFTMIISLVVRWCALLLLFIYR